MSSKDRLEELDRWHARAKKNPTGCFLVGTVGIIGIGYTLNEAGVSVLMEPSYKLAIQKQMFKRHDRQGNENEHTLTVLLWNKGNGIEEDMMKMNGHRMQVSA